ncbi:hypothetical protein AgCh_016078 [Apium graveolens]
MIAYISTGPITEAQGPIRRAQERLSFNLGEPRMRGNITTVQKKPSDYSSNHPPRYFLYNVHDADREGRIFKISMDKDDWGLLLEENLVLLDEPPFVETQ